MADRAYAYDPFGRRIAKQRHAPEAASGYRPLTRIHYRWDGDQFSQQQQCYAGSARELANEQGEVHWRGDQEIWGEYHQWGLSPNPK